MATPPDAHNHVHGDLHGYLLQARDIHGSVTVNATRALPEIADVSLDPPRLATAVRGRDGLLRRLLEAMVPGAPVPHVLTGPGGFGKTTVAAALAEHARAEGWSVFWVRSDAIMPSMLEVAIELGGSREEAAQVGNAPRRAARWAWRHLDSAPRPWLLVVDNADRPEELDPEHRPGEQRGWIRASPGGFALVTSRVDDPALWAPGIVHRIAALTDEDATTALADHAGVSGLPHGDALAARLGGVPLALSLAGRILATHGILFPDAGSLLSHLDGDISRMDELASPLGSGDERGRLSGIWELSLRLVGEQHPLAAPLLRKLSLLGSRDRVVPLWRVSVSASDPAGFARAVNALVVHGLIRAEREHGEVELRLHPLIAETVVAGLEEDDIPLILEVERLLREQGDRDPLFELGVHATLRDLADRLSALDRGFLVRVLLAEAPALLRSGRYAAAQASAESARRLAQEAWGSDDPLALQARHLIAEAWLFQDRVAEAEREYLDLLADRERVLGPEEPRTLDTRFQIALVKGVREQWEQAREEHREILAARLRVQGPDATETLDSMDALGYAALRSGDLDTAERLFEEVHEIRLRTLGAFHRQTLNADYKRGLVALRRGTDARARRIFQHVLDLRTRTLGSDHPQTRLVRERLHQIPDPRRENLYSGGSSA